MHTQTIDSAALGVSELNGSEVRSTTGGGWAAFAVAVVVFIIANWADIKEAAVSGWND